MNRVNPVYLNEISFDAVIDKIKSLKKIKFDYELAKLLKLEQSTLCEKRKRNALPYKEIIDFSVQENVSLDWLLFEGEAEIDPVKNNLKAVSEILNKLLLIKEDLSPDDFLTCFVKTPAMEPTLLLDDFIVIIKNCTPAVHGDGIYSLPSAFGASVVKSVGAAILALFHLGFHVTGKTWPLPYACGIRPRRRAWSLARELRWLHSSVRSRPSCSRAL